MEWVKSGVDSRCISVRDAASLVAWCQIWPVYSWLEWRHSSGGFSWSSCKLWHQPLGRDYDTWSRHTFWTGSRVRTCTTAAVILPCFCASCFFSESDTYKRGSRAFSPWDSQNSLQSSRLFIKLHRKVPKVIFHLWRRLHASAVSMKKLFSEQSKTACDSFVTLSYKAVGSILGALEWYVSGQGRRGGVNWQRLMGRDTPFSTETRHLLPSL